MKTLIPKITIYIVLLSASFVFASSENIKEPKRHAVSSNVHKVRTPMELECGTFKVEPHGDDPLHWSFVPADIETEGLRYTGCVTVGEKLSWQSLDKPGYYSRTDANGVNTPLVAGDTIRPEEVNLRLDSEFEIVSIGGETDPTKVTHFAIPVKPICIDGKCSGEACGGGGDSSNRTNCTAGMEPMNAQADKCVPQIPVGPNGLRALLN